MVAHGHTRSSCWMSNEDGKDKRQWKNPQEIWCGKFSQTTQTPNEHRPFSRPGRQKGASSGCLACHSLRFWLCHWMLPVTQTICLSFLITYLRMFEYKITFLQFCHSLIFWQLCVCQFTRLTRFWLHFALKISDWSLSIHNLLSTWTYLFQIKSLELSACTFCWSGLIGLEDEQILSKLSG